jgi:hypothetical protein
VKPALSLAYLAYGEDWMYKKGVPPFERYPAALRNFRKAIDADPSNRKAKDHVNTLEGIYKSMGRPVPQ